MDERQLAQSRIRQKRQRAIWRGRILDVYGPWCACCHESNKKFLTLDHKDNNGGEHRRSLKSNIMYMYKWIVDNNFPDSIQILCFNCNQGRALNDGVCPHND